MERNLFNLCILGIFVVDEAVDGPAIGNVASSSPAVPAAALHAPAPAPVALVATLVVLSNYTSTSLHTIFSI